MNLLRIKTLGPTVVKWFPRALVHGEGGLEGQPFELRDDQEDFINRWFAFRGDYELVFDRAYMETPKGVGKTQFMAGLTIEHALGPSRVALKRRNPNVVVAANSVRQAGTKRGGKHADDPELFGDGIFGRICQILNSESCPLSAEAKIFGDQIAFHNLPGGIRVIPSRASTVDGGLPTLYVADEVQDWTGNAFEAFDRVSNSTTKGDPPGRVLAASTPGAQVGDPSVGWRLRRLGERIEAGEVEDPYFLFVSHSASREWDLEDEGQRAQAVLEATPGLEAGSRRHVQIVHRFNEIHENDFRRFFLAQWTKSNPDSWLADREDAWERCTDSERVVRVLGVDVRPSPLVGVEDTERFSEDVEVWAGVDMSLKRDMSAVVWGTVDDGVHVVRARVFEPGQDGTIDHHEILNHVQWLSFRYPLRAVLYDPRYFELLAEDLDSRGVPVLEFPQSPERMSPACMNAWDLIVKGQVAHDGDVQFARHVNSAARRMNERGFTLSKGKSGTHIDACIAFVMASWAASSQLGGGVADPWVMSA